MLIIRMITAVILITMILMMIIIMVLITVMALAMIKIIRNHINSNETRSNFEYYLRLKMHLDLQGPRALQLLTPRNHPLQSAVSSA